MSVKLSRRTLVQAGTAALASVALPSLAQTAWPSKPIKIIVPYTAGGFTDQMARLLQVGLQKQLGCLFYTSPSPRDKRQSRMPSSA